MNRLFIVNWYDGNNTRITILYGDHDQALQWLREHSKDGKSINGVVSCPPMLGRDHIYVGIPGDSYDFQQFEGLSNLDNPNWDQVIFSQHYQQPQTQQGSSICPEHHEDCDTVYR
jgi:hypothetical protein